ncbi:MAG: zinc ribbon domain-containing protein [Clostridia bacterium]|nr:zinc ribbon domain-containing protein [Clostridia bacterium]
MKFCKKCGNAMEDVAAFCGKCGTAAELSEEAAAPEEVNRAEATPMESIPQTEPAPVQKPIPDGYMPAELDMSDSPYAPDSFISNFHENIGGSSLFLIAIILTSTVVVLQFITSLLGIMNGNYEHVFFLFGTLVTAGMLCTGLWLIYAASASPTLPEKCYIAFWLLKTFFILALIWQGLGLLVDLTSVYISMTGTNVMSQLGPVAQDGVGKGMLMLIKILLGKGTMLPYLCCSYYLIRSLEKKFDENEEDYCEEGKAFSVFKAYAVFCAVHAIGALLSSFFIEYNYVNVMGIILALINAVPLTIYAWQAWVGPFDSVDFDFSGIFF